MNKAIGSVTMYVLCLSTTAIWKEPYWNVKVLVYVTSRLILDTGGEQVMMKLH